MRALVAILVVFFVSPASAKPVRIVSSNLCSDQLVVALAEPSHILSLSHLAADPALSMVVDASRDYPPNRGSAEEGISLKPDLAMMTMGAGGNVAEALRRHGIQVETLPMPNTIAEVRHTVQRAAQIVGEDAKGRMLVAQIDKAFDGLSSCQGKRAVFYYPNGFTDGKDTLMDDVMQRLGMRNLAAEAGIRQMGHLPLERIITEKPDIIFTSRYGAQHPASGDALLHHPALSRVKIRNVELPQSLLICGDHHVAELVREIEKGCSSSHRRGEAGRGAL